MDRDRLAHLIMKYQPCGPWSQRRILKRLLDCQTDRNRSRGLKPSKLYDDNDDEDDDSDDDDVEAIDS